MSMKMELPAYGKYNIEVFPFPIICIFKNPQNNHSQAMVRKLFIGKLEGKGITVFNDEGSMMNNGCKLEPGASYRVRAAGISCR